MCALAVLISSSVCAAVPVQYSFTLWNWDTNYRDIAAFRRTVDACAVHGFTLIELGAAWEDCEKQEGQFDFSIVDERVAYVTSKGLGLRLRPNLYDWPAWYTPELFTDAKGVAFPHCGGYPSVFNAENRKRQYRLSGELAKHCAGHGYTYSPGFSVHMEVKFADWISYEPSARAAFRAWLAGRYGTVEALNAAWKTALASFQEIEPPVPADTAGSPSLDEQSNDWIRFREFALADWVAGFAAEVRLNDPSARISVPLGESYRRESARMANLGYWAYSRPADEVVHSYDFFWHGKNGLENSMASVAAFIGITQRPSILEVDGPTLLDQFGYTPADLVRVARFALEAGAAGIQVSNWGGIDVTQWPFLSEVGALVRERRAQGDWELPMPCPTLYYVSKWQNYVYREPSEWVHDRQFGYWLTLHRAGIPARIVTDENLLKEDLRAQTMVIPCGAVIDAPVRDRLRALSNGMRIVADDIPGLFTTSQKTEGQFGAKVEVLDRPFAEEKRAPAELLAASDKDVQTLRVAAVQFLTSFDVASNAAKIVGYIRQAADQGAKVVVFPEMALTGYSKAADAYATLDWKTVEAGLSGIRKACQDRKVYAIVGAPIRDGDAWYCAALAINPAGDIIDAYEKTYLAGEAWAKPGRKFTTFDIEGITCATIICHDERYGPLVQLRALRGAQLFFYISCESGASAENKLGPYRAQVQARAVENKVYVVHANTPANAANPQDPAASHGESRIVAPDGNLITEAPRYDDAVVYADLNLRRTPPRPGKAVTEGPLAAWMQQGLDLVNSPGKTP